MVNKNEESFGKKYKCCSKKLINLLFEKKQHIKAFPFIVYHLKDDFSFKAPFQIVLSVPKKIHKKAHDRNRIKRVLREVIRKNKGILESELLKSEKKLVLFLIYTAREELKYVILNDKIKSLFTLIINENTVHESNQN
ncbi:MAG: ribonuclease P protein component [Flavobacteriia bacterium]|nr:ribonuclease P protein component [Flavobacteriia bacterium]